MQQQDTQVESIERFWLIFRQNRSTFGRRPDESGGRHTLGTYDRYLFLGLRTFRHQHSTSTKPWPPVRLRRHRLFLPTRDMEGITTKTINNNSNNNNNYNNNNNDSRRVSLFLFLGTLNASLWLHRSQSVVDCHLPPSIHLPESIILECPSIAINAPYLPWLMTRLRMVVLLCFLVLHILCETLVDFLYNPTQPQHHVC
jgi:hypothetical protein